MGQFVYAALLFDFRDFPMTTILCLSQITVWIKKILESIGVLKNKLKALDGLLSPKKIIMLRKGGGDQNIEVSKPTL